MENRNRSAQRFISNTVASIAPPVFEHISITYSNLRGRRGGARGGEMAFATVNASPPRNLLSFEKRKNLPEKAEPILLQKRISVIQKTV